MPFVSVGVVPGNGRDRYPLLTSKHVNYVGFEGIFIYICFFSVYFYI